MKLEDKYSGEIKSVVDFDFERFVEGGIRNLQEDEDARAFSYADDILRPRHLIALNDLLRTAGPDKLFSATAPVVVFDGDVYNMVSRSTDTFEDLLKSLDDIIKSQRFTILYSIHRHAYVDQATFRPTVMFKYRFVELT